MARMVNVSVYPLVLVSSHVRMTLVMDLGLEDIQTAATKPMMQTPVSPFLTR